MIMTQANMMNAEIIPLTIVADNDGDGCSIVMLGIRFCSSHFS